MSYEEVQ
jgi:hypothetical protein